MLNNAVSGLVSLYQKEPNLTLRQALVFLITADRGEVGLSDIHRLLHGDAGTPDEHTNISKAVKGLRDKRGLVVKTDGKDEKHRNVVITKKGELLAHEIRKAMKSD